MTLNLVGAILPLGNPPWYNQSAQKAGVLNKCAILFTIKDFLITDVTVPWPNDNTPI